MLPEENVNTSNGEPQIFGYLEISSMSAETQTQSSTVDCITKDGDMYAILKRSNTSQVYFYKLN